MYNIYSYKHSMRFAICASHSPIHTLTEIKLGFSILIKDTLMGSSGAAHLHHFHLHHCRVSARGHTTRAALTQVKGYFSHFEHLYCSSSLRLVSAVDTRHFGPTYTVSSFGELAKSANLLGLNLNYSKCHPKSSAKLSDTLQHSPVVSMTPNE